MSYKYYRVKKKYLGYRGERYFQFDPDNDYAIQICIHQGRVKKGRAHTYGIYRISRNTFLANYKGMGMVERIPKSEFKKHFILMIKVLKP
ncbi:MAG: hypothetical protein DRI97_06150 [Bacteroidetes bacterium]|nr:MAG: hypothetical protein DRI97_06150 [Bacteroidota bacterium]